MNRYVVSVLFAALASGAATAQWAMTQTNNPPPAYRAVLSPDLFGGRMLLWGGAQRFTWSFDGTVWTQENPVQSPSPRQRTTIVFDIGRQVHVMYGATGSNPNNGVNNDETWEWDGTNWSQPNVARTPGGLAKHAMVYDLSRSRTVLYGGEPNSWAPGAVANTWEFDGSLWTQIVTPNSPGPRQEHSMCYDFTRGLTVLFGGQDPRATTLDDDTWTYDGTDWTLVNVTGPRPAPRINAGMVFDPARNVCVLFGGIDPSTMAIFNDTWEFNGTSWRQIPGTAAGVYPPRAEFAMAMDAVRGRIVLFGGRTASTAVLDETWEYGANFRTYGIGCAGSNGVPTLVSTVKPRLGSTVTASIGNLNPSTSLAVMFVGLSNRTSSLGPLPLQLTAQGMPGCRLYASNDTAAFLSASAGVAIWSFRLPTNPNLVGAAYYQQGLALDPGINPAGMTMSNAGAAVIGY